MLGRNWRRFLLDKEAGYDVVDLLIWIVCGLAIGVLLIGVMK